MLPLLSAAQPQATLPMKPLFSNFVSGRNSVGLYTHNEWNFVSDEIRTPVFWEHLKVREPVTELTWIPVMIEMANEVDK